MKNSHSCLAKFLALVLSAAMLVTTVKSNVYGVEGDVLEEPENSTAVDVLQNRIDELPSHEEFISIRSDEARQVVINEASSICDVYYDELSEEEQASIIFDKVIEILETTCVATPLASASEFDNSKSAEELVGALLGSGITATNQEKRGSLYYYSGSGDDFEIDKGVVLTTNSNGSSTQDSDLAALIASEGKTYGGHTSVLEFELTATGTLLNFNYEFASREFNQGPTFNDIFGLFVSVNGGAYENIALLDNGKHVTISNLRAGSDGTQFSNGASTNIVNGTDYDYFRAKCVSTGITDGEMNGVSHLFNAQKAVNKGDSIKIKFVIADVGDASYDSMVIIQAGSLSFDAPGTKPDYSEETLTDFDAGFLYEITVKNEDGTDGEKYLFEVGEGGTIPMTGTDKDGNPYDFIGKTISIVKKGDGETTLDSDPQEVEISDRPDVPNDPTASMDTPDDVNVSDILTSSSSIIVAAEEGIQYSIDGITWKSPDEDGFVSFTDVIPNAVYKVYSRKAPTESSPASDRSDGTEVIAKDIPVTLDSITTNGIITCPVAFVPNRWITSVMYNGAEPIRTANGEYIIIGDGEPHDLVLRDRAGNETQYSVTAYKSHKFSAYDQHPTEANKLIAYCDHGCGRTNIIDKPVEVPDGNDPIGEKETTTAGGLLETEVKLEEGTPTTKIAGLSTELARDVFLSSEEINKLNTKEIEYKIWMNIETLDISENIEAKDNLDAKASEIDEGIVIGVYLDLTLHKSITENGSIDDEELVNVDTITPLSIVINLPEELIAPEGKARTYYIIRNHNNVADIIDCTYNSDNQTLSTSSSLFSEYAIAYVETELPPVTPPGGNTEPPVTPPGGNTEPPVTPPGGNTEPPVIPPGGNTEPPVTPPGGNTEPSVTPQGGTTGALPIVENPYIDEAPNTAPNNSIPVQSLVSPVTSLVNLLIVPLSTNESTKNTKEPKTGDKGTPMATVGMIAGFLYIAELFHERKIGMTAEQKDAIVKKIIGFAKTKSKPVKYAAIILIMLILAFYNSIGKKIEVEVENEIAGAI